MSLITIASRYGTSAKMLFTRCVNQNRLPLTSFTSPSPFKITSFSDRSINVGLRLFASKSSPSSKAPAKKSAVVKKTASKTASKASPKTATKVSKASKTKKTVVVKKAAPKKAVKSVEAKKKDDAEKASLAKDKLKERQARDKEREIQMREKEKARLVKLKEKERLTQAKEKAKAVILKEKERKAALPKRPKSAFTYFMTQQINGRAKLYDGKQSVEIMPLAAAKWAKMSDSEKKSFNAEAAKDRARYEKEKAEFIKNAPPKRPLTAFFLYANEVRANIRKQNPKLSITDVAKKVGEGWKKLSATEQEKYRKASKKASDDFYKKYPKKE